MEYWIEICVVDDAVISTAVFSVQLFLHFFYFFLLFCTSDWIHPYILADAQDETISQLVIDSFMRNLNHHVHSPSSSSWELFKTWHISQGVGANSITRAKNVNVLEMLEKYKEPHVFLIKVNHIFLKRQYGSIRIVPDSNFQKMLETEIK